MTFMYIITLHRKSLKKKEREWSSFNILLSSLKWVSALTDGQVGTYSLSRVWTALKMHLKIGRMASVIVMNILLTLNTPEVNSEKRPSYLIYGLFRGLFLIYKCLEISCYLFVIDF